jgi:sugar lactone lactonase YvrE
MLEHNQALQLNSRTKALLFVALLLMPIVILLTPVQNIQAATTYTSLTYNGQIKFSYEEVLNPTQTVTGTAQFNFTITLNQPVSGSAKDIEGGATAQGTFSGVYQGNTYTGCPAEIKIEATFTTSIRGETSVQADKINMYGDGFLSNFEHSASGPSRCYTDQRAEIGGILNDCFGGGRRVYTNQACREFPIDGGTKTITKGTSTAYKSISGTAQLTLVSSQQATTTSSTSTTTSGTDTTTSPDCDFSGFAVQLFGVRTTSSQTTYLTVANVTDTLFIDGKFFQPALPPHSTIDVRVTVTITGADDVPINYIAPVSGSLGAQPTPDVPTTWVTLQPPSPPVKRPVGLWQAIASAQVSLTTDTCAGQLGPIFSNVVPFLVRSKAPNSSLQFTFPDGKTVPIPVYGNLTADNLSGAEVVDTDGLYTLKFNASGPANSAGSMTMVVAKNLIPTRWTPAVIVNGIRIPVSYQTPQLVKQCPPVCYVAAFSQDDDNYYIRVTMHFSTNSIEVQLLPAFTFTNGQGAALVLGKPSFTEYGGSQSQNGLYGPVGVTRDPKGNIWVVDQFNNRIVEYTPPFSTFMKSSLAIGQPDFTSNATATTQTGLRYPSSVAFDSSGDLWVADTYNNRVLKFTAPFSSGMPASLVIGQTSYVSRDGSTTPSSLFLPTSIAFDPSGSLWIADQWNNRILKFNPPFSSGMAASLVIGQSSFSSHLRQTTQSGLNLPQSIAFDAAGNLWVTDRGNNRTLGFYAPFSNGMPASVVIGQSEFSTGWSATTPNGLAQPWGLMFDSEGDLWIADWGNRRVLEFVPPFSNGMALSVVIGQKSFTSSEAVSSQDGLGNPAGITLDRSGNLWVADWYYSRVMMYGGATLPIPEFPSIGGVNVLMLTWLLTLLIVGALISRHLSIRHKSFNLT